MGSGTSGDGEMTKRPGAAAHRDERADHFAEDRVGASRLGLGDDLERLGFCEPELGCGPTRGLRHGGAKLGTTQFSVRLEPLDQLPNVARPLVPEMLRQLEITNAGQRVAEAAVGQRPAVDVGGEAVKLRPR
jgi:hypothetical protein